MLRRGLYQSYSPFSKLCILGIILLACIFIALFCTSLYTFFIKGDPQSINNIRGLLLIQNSILFILSSYIATYLLWDKPVQQSLNLKLPGLLLIILGCLAIVFSGPFINLLHEWNKLFQLPEFMSALENWLIEAENNASLLTEKILNVNLWSQLLMNLLVIAILAGVGEELLFRGVLQKIFTEWTKNIHLGVLITAFIFSFIHFQFFGFLPRLALGILLGYLYFYSGSLWIPILAHTFNNAMIVIFTPNQLNEGNKVIENINLDHNSPVYAIMSLLIVGCILYYIRRVQQVKDVRND